MMPLVWMRLIRDGEPKRTTKRLAVLWALALRMNQHGVGFATAEQLAQDASVHRATVARATAAERATGYLIQTRRGHRIAEDVVAASEWRLTDPTQSRTDATLEADPTSQTAGPNVANGRPNVADKASLRGPLQEVLIKSKDAAARVGANGADRNGSGPDDDLDLDKQKTCQHQRRTADGDCLDCQATEVNR